MKAPKILLLDIETAPKLAYVWALYDQNISLNQLKSDSHILSIACKWLGETEVYYKDQRNKKDISNDKDLLKFIWKFINQADIIIMHNGDKFDIKKINTQFVIYDLDPLNHYRTIDTLKIAKKYFSFTSNKLEYLTNKLNKKYKKLNHAKFAGFELWKQCLNNNLSAWEEMKKYNIYDILSLEELYMTLRKWDNSINYNIFYEDLICECGSKSFKKNGIKTNNRGKFQRYKCNSCHKEFQGKTNMISKKVLDKLKFK